MILLFRNCSGVPYVPIPSWGPSCLVVGTVSSCLSPGLANQQQCSLRAQWEGLTFRKAETCTNSSVETIISQSREPPNFDRWTLAARAIHARLVRLVGQHFDLLPMDRTADVACRTHPELLRRLSAKPLMRRDAGSSLVHARCWWSFTACRSAPLSAKTWHGQRDPTLSLKLSAV